MIDETFKKYFKFPLIQREKFLYVFGNDGNMALTWLTGDLSEEEKSEIVNKINGYSKVNYDLEWSIKDRVFIYYGDKKIFLVRGWGMLTGVASYHLNEILAKKLQDNFAKYIVSNLNQKIEK